MIRAQKLMPDAVQALRRLPSQGYRYQTIPDRANLKGIRGPVDLATSAGVAKGWGMTTFPGDCGGFLSLVLS
jgi:hypothetical protein